MAEQWIKGTMYKWPYAHIFAFNQIDKGHHDISFNLFGLLGTFLVQQDVDEQGHQVLQVMSRKSFALFLYLFDNDVDHVETNHEFLG